MLSSSPRCCTGKIKHGPLESLENKGLEQERDYPDIYMENLRETSDRSVPWLRIKQCASLNIGAQHYHCTNQFGDRKMGKIT
jgi:hypothetical protein